jgi:excinuclease ABC subunit B
VILYADRETGAISEMMRITRSHRERQMAYNLEHGIKPRSVKRTINESSYLFKASDKASLPAAGEERLGPAELVAELKREMLEAADRLEFERAAYLRDRIADLEGERRRKSSAKGGRRKK